MKTNPSPIRMNLLSETKNRLILLMKRQGTVTAQEVSEALGLAVSTVRQHLSNLECDGFIESYFERDGVGRPSKQYRLTDKSDVFFTNCDGLILSRLVEFLHQRGDGAKLDEFFDLLVEELLDEFPEHFLELSSEEKIERLEKVLESQGYISKLNRRPNGELVINLYHCPFATVTEGSGVSCEFDRLLLSRLFDSSRIRKARDGLVGGCRFVIKPSKDNSESRCDSACPRAATESSR